MSQLTSLRLTRLVGSMNPYNQEEHFSNAAKLVTFVEKSNFHLVENLSLVLNSRMFQSSSLCWKSDISSLLATRSDLSRSKLFSCASKYRKFPSSTLRRTKPNPKLTLAAECKLSKTCWIFSLKNFGVTIVEAKVKTCCPPLTNSESTEKSWQAGRSWRRGCSS